MQPELKTAIDILRYEVSGGTDIFTALAVAADVIRDERAVECKRLKALDRRCDTDPSSPFHHDNRCVVCDAAGCTKGSRADHLA